MIDDYEQLRSTGLGATTAGHPGRGLTVLLHRGLVAWMQAADAVRSSSPPTSSPSCPPAVVPQAVAPQVAVPQVAVPQVAVPQVAVPQVAVPQVAVPQVAASEMVTILTQMVMATTPTRTA